MKKAMLAPPPNLQASPRIEFFEGSFDALVHHHGYSITIEPAFPCPCKKRDQAQSICLNCQGSGWTFGTPVQTKAIIQSINRSTKYKDWSEQLIGMANITVEQRFQLSAMDKITMIDSVTISSQNLLVREMTNDGKLFAVATFPIKHIQFLFKFVSVNEPLQMMKLNEDFTFDGDKIIFNDGVKKDDSITVRYGHNIQFAVVDINHDIRNVYLLDDMGREKQSNLPVSAVIQRLHCQMDGLNFAKNNLIYNETV